MNYNYKASIVLVNYNGKKYIDKLFDSLEKLNTPKEDYEVIFVDNASSDNSVDYLKLYLKNKESKLNVRLVKSNHNLGFAGGNNLGVKHSRGEYVVLLNNDTSVDKEWLNELINKISSDENIGMVNSKLLFYYDFVRLTIDTIDGLKASRIIKINGKESKIEGKFSDLVYVYPNKDYVKCLDTATIFVPLLDGITDYDIEFEILQNVDDYDYIEVDFDRYKAKKGVQSFHIPKEQVQIIKETLVQNAGSAINEWNDGYDIGFGQPDGDAFSREYEIESGCGASIIMRHDDFDALGGFDEEFFMYYEDTDLSFRMRNQLNKKIVYCPKSIVRHFHTGSSTEWSKFFTYYVIRNKLIFIYKNKSKEEFEKTYKSTIRSAIREHYRTSLRIRAAKDAKRIINGEKNIRY